MILTSEGGGGGAARGAMFLCSARGGQQQRGASDMAGGVGRAGGTEMGDITLAISGRMFAQRAPGALPLY